MHEESGSSLHVHSELSTEGIRQAVEALSYRSHHSPKYRLVDALLRIHCRQAENGGPRGVANDDLIRLLWNTDGPDGVLISRRRNLSSLRSSVNSDLMAQYRSGGNPDGVIIGPDNAFSICDEAKDEALKALRSMSGLGQGPLDMNRIGDMLRDIRALLSSGDESNETIGRENEKAARDRLREVIRELADQVGVRVLGGPGDADIPPGGRGEEAGDSGSGPDVEEVLEEVEVEDQAEDPVLDEVELEDAADDLEVVEELGFDGEDEETDEGVAFQDRLDGWEGVGDTVEGPLNPEKARLLAEEFNRSLAAMDQFYNQYILVSGEDDGMASKRLENGDSSGNRRPLSDFYIGQFPVTNALFEVFVEKTGYRTIAERTGWGMVYHGRYHREVNDPNGRKSLQVRSGITCARVEGACWYQPWGPGSTLRNRRNHPVVQVSLEDAVAFAAWTGKRLPTEEEWEAAMRTPKGHEFPWGNEWKNDACNVEESCIGDTTAVDQYLAFANGLGIADGLGNVMEWTLTRGSGPDDARRTAKGASWIAGNGITLGGRTLLELDARSNILGFRCVAV